MKSKNTKTSMQSTGRRNNSSNSKRKTKAAKMEAEFNQSAKVIFDIKFYGGVGQINLAGQNVDRKATANSNFSVTQRIGFQSVQVDGIAPAGDDGKIEVQVSQGEEILSRYADNVFKNLFNSDINYTIH
ncbi:MAG: hypothetical protein JST75_09215 [Bacteroidetes bacterium]|nr:hypothetical protein [Bacteroidota bacterium]